MAARLSAMGGSEAEKAVTRAAAAGGAKGRSARVATAAKAAGKGGDAKAAPTKPASTTKAAAQSKPGTAAKPDGRQAGHRRQARDAPEQVRLLAASRRRLPRPGSDSGPPCGRHRG